jgi:putative zinc- or iron-chelating protein
MGSDSERDESGTARRFALNAVRETLGTSSDVDSCAVLAASIDSLLDQAFEHFQKDGAGIACRAGCSFCCHLRVMVYPHEAIALFRYLGSRMPKEHASAVRQRVLENADAIGEAAREGRAPPRTACAFLIEGKCSAYEARPGACAGYHSLSREHCEKTYGDPAASAEGTPVLQALRYIAEELADGLDEGLAAARLSGMRIELQAAVAALIRNPSLIARWRAGRELTTPEKA